MNAEVQKELDKLDISSLQDSSGIVRLDEVELENFKPARSMLFSADINNETYLFKPWRGIKSIGAMTLSKIYRDSGVETPLVLPTYKHEPEGSRTLGTIQKKISSTDNFEIGTMSSMMSNHFLSGLSRFFFYVKDLETILTDEHIRDYFLEVMTPECLEDYNLNYLLGVLSGETDIHPGNILIWKMLEDERFRGIVPIDKEECAILLSEMLTDEVFSDFLYQEIYNCVIPTLNLDNWMTHAERIDKLNRFIGTGALSEKQIKTLKAVVNTDAGAVVKNICRSDGIDELFEYRKVAYENFSRIWNYNRENLTELER